MLNVGGNIFRPIYIQLYKYVYLMKFVSLDKKLNAIVLLSIIYFLNCVYVCFCLHGQNKNIYWLKLKKKKLALKNEKIINKKLYKLYD